MSPEELIAYGIRLASKPTGGRADNLERSIEAFTAARDALPADTMPYLRAVAEHQLAMSLQERLVGQRAENLDAAMQAYGRAAALLRGLTTQPAHNLLGETLGNVSSIQLALGDADAAIRSAEESLQYLPKSVNPRARGVSYQNLGVAYQHRRAGSRRRNLERAIAAYDAALEVRPADGPEPALHRNTITARQLAAAELHRLVTGDRSAGTRRPPKDLIRGQQLHQRHQQEGDPRLLDAAIEAYSSALRVLDENTDPQWWGSAMNNLASCYATRRAGAEDTERAITGYLAAMRVRTRTTEPLLWARTQYSLALGYLHRKTGDPIDNARAAVAAGEGALEVLTQQVAPDEWLDAVHNLGLAHLELHRRAAPEGDPTGLLRGIALLETAGSRPSGDPEQDRQRHVHLGTAYLSVTEHQEIDRMNRLEAKELALHHFRTVQRISTDDTSDLRTRIDTMVALLSADRSSRDPITATEEFIAQTEASFDSLAADLDPADFATLAAQLGAAYLRRAAGDRSDNLRRAREVYTRALASCDPADSTRLGFIHSGLADVCQAAGDVTEASAQYRRAAATYSDASDTHDREVADALARLYAVQTAGTRRRWLLPRLSPG